MCPAFGFAKLRSILNERFCELFGHSIFNELLVGVFFKWPVKLYSMICLYCLHIKLIDFQSSCPMITFPRVNVWFMCDSAIAILPERRAGEDDLLKGMWTKRFSNERLINKKSVLMDYNYVRWKNRTELTTRITSQPFEFRMFIMEALQFALTCKLTMK